MSYFYKPYVAESVDNQHYMRFDSVVNPLSPSSRNKMPGFHTNLKWKKISNFVLNEDEDEFEYMINKLKNSDLTTITKNIRQTKLEFSRLMSKKRQRSKRGVLVQKSTMIVKKDKPLVTESIQRKVTEILKKGLFSHIQNLLKSANRPDQTDLHVVHESSLNGNHLSTLNFKNFINVNYFRCKYTKNSSKCKTKVNNLH